MTAKKIRFLLVCLSITISDATSAQTFLNKRIGCSVGTSTSLPMFGRSIFQYTNIKSDFTVFPPGVTADLSVSVSSRFQLSINGSFRGLRDVHYMPSRYVETLEYSEYHSDDFLLRMNALELGGQVKFYEEYAPIGKYVFFGVSSFRSKGQIYSTLTKTRYSVLYNAVPDPETHVDKLEPWSVNENYIGIRLGLGKTILISKNVVIDYGFKSGIFFGIKEFQVEYNPVWDHETYDFETNFSEPMKSIMHRNLFSSYLAEFYLNFGLQL